MTSLCILSLLFIYGATEAFQHEKMSEMSRPRELEVLEGPGPAREEMVTQEELMVSSCERGDTCSLSAEVLAQKIVERERDVLKEDDILVMQTAPSEQLGEELLAELPDEKEVMMNIRGGSSSVYGGNHCTTPKNPIPRVCNPYCSKVFGSYVIQCKNFLYDKRLRFMYQRIKVMMNCFKCHNLCNLVANSIHCIFC